MQNGVGKDELPMKAKVPNQAAPGDWVKDLFAPIYDFNAIIEAGKQSDKLEKPHIKRASILDPQTIREVFERVHQRVVESERLKQEELEEKRQKEEDNKLDPRKSSIWDTQELDTLRKVYKSAKGEISRLEAELRESKNHSQHLKTELAAQREETDSLVLRLDEAVKANQRLVIHRDSLQHQVAVMEVKVAALTDMWHEIDGLKLKAMEAEKAARQELDSERLQRQKLECDLTTLQQNAERDRELVMRDVQTRFEIDINDLQDVVKDLTLELQREKQQHEASRRGLDHLRLHFSSLPLRDVLPPGAVEDDQVKRIDHCDSL
ncbi:leucine zipper putative tumor suppressor 1-like [Elysia marginata]|uniref:Leucine zipper putative tumor suppressor 1-like n=1 Tax=Elysia marginata TaxID=1093978 RepID=A0AAV4H280_9GAST|nr:leucine zipper putative tumor suppressor 1-like [Elysia marginata]